MSEKPASTIGFERRFNRFAHIGDEREFVRVLTDRLDPQPSNFKLIVELNRGPLLTEAAPLEPLAPERVHELLEGGGALLDGRDTRDFDAAHVPGSINVTMARAAVGTRAAWVLDPEAGVIVSAGSEEAAVRMARMLEAVGFRMLLGYLAGGIGAWRAAGLEIGSTPAIDVPELAERLRRGDVVLLDVREDDEWNEGHVEGSLHVPYHDLRDGVPDELRAGGGKQLAVACSAGNRSAIAASLLRRAGVEDLVHVADGGVADLREEGIELVAGSS